MDKIIDRIREEVILSKNVKKSLSLECLLENLAEECCELSHASLKLARIMRDENPTPVTEEEAYENLKEEVTDVFLILDILGPLYSSDEKLYYDKLKRWSKRIENSKEMKDGEQHEPGLG